MKIFSTLTKAWVMLTMLSTSVFVHAQTIYGLTADAKLVSFSASMPSTFLTNTTITGINAGQTLVGMDTRPATGELIVLGYNATNDSATVYSLNPNTAVLTAKGASIKLTGLGSSVGFDFNPTVDRIRVVSKTGKNFRLNPNNGALAATDGALVYAATDVNTGKTPGASACAYTNSYIASTNTTLYTYDETQKVLTLQNPPNDGVLNTQIALTGIASTAIISDLDIYTDPSNFMSTTYAVARTGTVDSFYTLNISTGVFTKIGAFSSNIVDIAVKIDRTMPAMMGTLAYGLTFTAGNSSFNFLKFDSKNPTFIRSAQVITGLKTGQSIVGMDSRPQDSKIYMLGYRSTDSVATIYTLNDTTAALSVYAGADSFKIALGTAQVSFDFNPAANRLRIISAANRNNYRLNLTVNPITVTVDTALTYKTTDINMGKMPFVVTGAYTNSYNGATATQLYDIDATLGTFANQNSANGGFLATIGSLGLTLDPNDYSIDLDILSNKTAATDTAFLMANTLDSKGFDNLYTVNISTGAATLVGRIGLGIAVRNIAFYVTPVTTSLRDLPNTLAAEIYPNPTNSTISLNFDNSKGSSVQVDIFNLQGQSVVRKVFSKGIHQFNETIEVGHLNHGTYFVRIANEHEATVKKMIKM